MERGGLDRKRCIKHFRDLEVYQRAFKAAMTIFRLTKEFPDEEKYSMVDQIRRASRSVCSNLSEAWRKTILTFGVFSLLSFYGDESASGDVVVSYYRKKKGRRKPQG